jgi:hypothetical protein
VGHAQCGDGLAAGGFSDDTMAAMRAEQAPLMLDVTAHTHVLGRPLGAWVFDEIMQRVKACDDVWICTRQEMARHVLDHTRGTRTEAGPEGRPPTTSPPAKPTLPKLRHAGMPPHLASVRRVHDPCIHPKEM